MTVNSDKETITTVGYRKINLYEITFSMKHLEICSNFQVMTYILCEIIVTQLWHCQLEHNILDKSNFNS